MPFKDKSKRYAVAKAWRDKNMTPEKYRELAYRKRYGIGSADVLAILESQNGKCALCPKSLVFPDKGTHLDHDHLTGRIRGVLCKQCNTGLGNGRDSLDFIRKLIIYLQLNL